MSIDGSGLPLVKFREITRLLARQAAREFASAPASWSISTSSIAAGTGIAISTSSAGI